MVIGLLFAIRCGIGTIYAYSLGPLTEAGAQCTTPIYVEA
jgi:hypothetical protein